MKPYSIYAYCILLLTLLVACEKPKEPEFKRIENIQLLSLTKEKAVVKADVIMENPNPIGVDIAAMSIDTWMNGVKVGTTTQTEKATISPGTFTLPIQVDAPVREIFNKDNIGGAISALLNKKVDLKYEGYITLSIAGIETKVNVLHEDEITLKKSEVVDEGGE